jgi:hypothetical protein
VRFGGELCVELAGVCWLDRSHVAHGSAIGRL